MHPEPTGPVLQHVSNSTMANTASQQIADAAVVETVNAVSGELGSESSFYLDDIPEAIPGSSRSPRLAHLPEQPAAVLQSDTVSSESLEVAPGLHEWGKQAAAAAPAPPDAGDPFLGPGGPVAEGTPARHTSLRSMPGEQTESVDEEAETTLMHRMIGISPDPFRRMGRLKRGQHFGERECYLGIPRSFSMVTVIPSEMYCLERHHLIEFVTQWPELADSLRISRITLEERTFQLPLRAPTWCLDVQSLGGIDRGACGWCPRCIYP